MRERLSIEEVNAALSKLNAWQRLDDREAIAKTYKFKNFTAAMAFMNKVALVAEDMDHHPEWFNVYNRLDVVLTTHSANGITQLDIDLAKAMDDLF